MFRQKTPAAECLFLWAIPTMSSLRMTSIRLTRLDENWNITQPSHSVATLNLHVQSTMAASEHGYGNEVAASLKPVGREHVLLQ